MQANFCCNLIRKVGEAKGRIELPRHKRKDKVKVNLLLVVKVKKYIED